MGKPEDNQVKVHPDAWSRFERAVDVVAKSPPQHRVKKPAKNRKKAGKGGASSSKPKSAPPRA
jgi:hypothetical protein